MIRVKPNPNNNCMCPGGPRSLEVPSQIGFSLMQPGRVVKLRYGTTQFTSGTGIGWRTVTVISGGHVGETDYGRRSRVQYGSEGYGWWVYDNDIRKFFLKNRILEISLD